ncbi:MAG TPA: hypothetical protein VIY27_01740 [Myxococcota bacterium]
MHGLGLLMIGVGFLAGSLAAVQSPENSVEWRGFVPALAFGAAGVVLARRATRAAARHEGVLERGVRTARESLACIVENARRLDAEKETLDAYAAHARVDALFRDDLVAFVDAREAIGHAFGLEAYAAVMNDFAAGERYLNRVWSASIDGWVDEVAEYVVLARAQFEAAQRTLAALGE